MEFLDKRVNVICEELKKLTIRQRVQIPEWKFKKGFFLHPQDADAAKPEWKEFISGVTHWDGPDEHYWFKSDFTVPQSMDHKQLQLHVQTQSDDWDYGRNPQFLAFVDGQVLQGMDMNHREVRLGDGACAGQRIGLELQAYTGSIHKGFSLFAEIQEVDTRIEKLYYDLWVPLAALPRMEKESRQRKMLEGVLNECVNLLDLRTPYSESFYTSLKCAQEYLERELYEKLSGYDEVIATCIGHTHIDVAWWWTVEQTREKVARSFSTVLKLMDEYPNYRFMSSQPQLYQFLKERYPELYEKVKERVREKRWEPEGGMWVEADCNLTSGESLVRQFMHGKRFFREEFGVDNKILWLPDVFGYSGALPQIMKKSGIEYFMTTKLSWNQFNKIPYDTMLWRGIDGSEVLTHMVTTRDVGQGEERFITTYNGMLHPDAIMGGWERYQNKDINDDILICYGYGDGGGGPTRQMLETSARMERGIRGIPKVRQEFAGVYFDGLEKRVAGNKRLPVWEGELYFEYHRGTYTSMARNKRSNRKSELALMDLELLSVMAQDRLEYPADELENIWKKVLLNQFHDILPGSSIHEVYEVTKKEYREIADRMEGLIAERLRVLTPEGASTVTIFNTTGYDRDDVVALQADCPATALYDEEGTKYPVQRTKDGAVAYVKKIPSKGSRTFGMKTGAGCESVPFHVTGSTLETPFYIVHVNEAGFFDSIYDKAYDRELVQEGKCANQLRMYEDKPMDFDNWDIDIYYTEKYWDVTGPVRMEWTEMGPVRCTLCLEWRISGSFIRQEIHFYAEDRRIEFSSYVDWKEHQHLLKAHFPVAVHTDEAAFDVQFGNVTRKTHANTSWDAARFESCGQKWIDLSEGHYGVSLLNDCKYGHSIKDGDMALTLIKSGIEPNPVADQEEHYFTYAIYPHGETWKEAQTVKKAYFFNQPAYAVPGGRIGESRCFAAVDRPNVVLETIKAAEDRDGIIIRLYESENALTKVRLKMDFEILDAEECNLLEEKSGEAEWEKNTLVFTIKPYEIKTFRIRR